MQQTALSAACRKCRSNPRPAAIAKRMQHYIPEEVSTLLQLLISSDHALYLTQHIECHWVRTRHSEQPIHAKNHVTAMIMDQCKLAHMCACTVEHGCGTQQVHAAFLQDLLVWFFVAVLCAAPTLAMPSHYFVLYAQWVNLTWSVAKRDHVNSCQKLRNACMTVCRFLKGPSTLQPDRSIRR